MSIQEPTKELDSLKPLFSWNTPEFHKRERSKQWYVLVVTISVLLLVSLYFLDSKSGMALVFVSMLFLIFFKLKPKMIDCMLYDDGIVVSNKVYHYSDFVSFSLDNDAVVPRLRFKIPGRVGGIVFLPLANTDADSIYKIITQNVPEVQDTQSDLIDLINKIL